MDGTVTKMGKFVVDVKNFARCRHGSQSVGPAAPPLFRSSALSLFHSSAIAAAAAIVLLAKVVRRESDGRMSQKVGSGGGGDDDEE